jgi:hypothetical protein
MYNYSAMATTKRSWLATNQVAVLRARLSVSSAHSLPDLAQSDPSLRSSSTADWSVLGKAPLARAQSANAKMRSGADGDSSLGDKPARSGLKGWDADAGKSGTSNNLVGDAASTRAEPAQLSSTSNRLGTIEEQRLADSSHDVIAGQSAPWSRRMSSFSLDEGIVIGR